MATHQSIRAIAIMPSLDAIGQAVDQLVLSGFPLAQIFLVGRDIRSLKPEQRQLMSAVPVKELLHEANLHTMTQASSNRRRGMMIGNCTGGVAGLLMGVGLLAIPGIGEIVLGGSVVLYLLSLTGVGTVTGGALGAIISHGMARRLINNYLAQVLQGNYLLLVSGTEADIARAGHILYAQGHQKPI